MALVGGMAGEDPPSWDRVEQQEENLDKDGNNFLQVCIQFLVFFSKKLHFQDRSVSEIENSFSEHFVAIDDDSSGSSNEFPSSDSLFLAKIDRHNPFFQSNFASNISRPASNCSTVVNSALTPTQQSCPTDVPDVETPANVTADIKDPQSEKEAGKLAIYY